MPRRRISLTVDAAEIDTALAALREELDIREDFPAAALAEAQAAAARPLPEPGGSAPEQRPCVPVADRRDIPFVTVDPPTSMDLDQAAALEETEDGYRLFYAIACLAFVVEPGGALDAEVHRRGTSMYGPGDVVQLHPRVLSTDAASLLPGVDRLAYVWRIEIDHAGTLHDAHVEPALVRSRVKLSYDDVQAALEGRAVLPAGTPENFPGCCRPSDRRA
ncbi:MAG: RNB domain-containing ribonuclease [Bowdeniella nasicola]|nr:RNB domain-containing ribonuclease [Bowdeniella nasicola]